MSAPKPVRAVVTLVVEAESQSLVRDYAAGALRGPLAPLPGDGLADKLAALIALDRWPGITATVDSVNALPAPCSNCGGDPLTSPPCMDGYAVAAWESVARLLRSYEDPDVWVPVVPDTDQEPFLHAGGLRRAKAYVASSHLPGEVVEWRWRRTDPDCWDLEVRWEAP